MPKNVNLSKDLSFRNALGGSFMKFLVRRYLIIYIALISLSGVAIAGIGDTLDMDTGVVLRNGACWSLKINIYDPGVQDNVFLPLEITFSGDSATILVNLYLPTTDWYVPVSLAVISGTLSVDGRNFEIVLDTGTFIDRSGVLGTLDCSTEKLQLLQDTLVLRGTLSGRETFYGVNWSVEQGIIEKEDGNGAISEAGSFILD